MIPALSDQTHFRGLFISLAKPKTTEQSKNERGPFGPFHNTNASEATYLSTTTVRLRGDRLVNSGPGVVVCKAAKGRQRRSRGGQVSIDDVLVL
jgi:hypothetical protein